MNRSDPRGCATWPAAQRNWLASLGALLRDTEHTSMTRASEIVHGFAKLPSSRSDYFQVKSVVEDPNSSMTDLAKIISADPPLTARLLKLVKSNFPAR